MAKGNIGTILFVGTKKQAQDAIKSEAERCGMFYVNERWLGGMLTNFKTIQSRIARLKEIEAMSEDGTFDVLPKKEVIEIKKEWEKLQQLTVEELVARENELKAELFNLRFQHATGQLTNPMRLKECKREIARVKTLINARA